MLTCEDCNYLTELSEDCGEDYKMFCGKIANCDLSQYVTAYDDEGGRYAILVINNPYKFGCLLHSKFETYYKRITKEYLIPKDDKRIVVK